MLESWRKPRLDHPDAKIRAEAFAQLPPDDPRYVSALHADDDLSLRVGLVARLTDSALLAKLHAGSDGEQLAAAAAARLRILIAEADAEADDSALFGRGDDVGLLQFALHGAGSPALRRAAFAALVAQGEVSDELRESLAAGAGDAGLRALAASGLENSEALERVAQAVRKSDKPVYRIVRDRLAGQRAAAERAARRAVLLEELATLAARPLEGQNDALHRRMARLQNWRDAWRDSGADTDVDATDASTGKEGVEWPAEAAAAVAHIETLIAGARETVEGRKSLLRELTDALADDSAATTDIDHWRQRWEALDDHSEAQRREFERQLDRLDTHGKDAQRQASLDARAETLLNEWESTDWSSVPSDPKRLVTLEKLWAGLGAKGTPAEPLGERYRALRDKLAASIENRQAVAEAAAGELRAMVAELSAQLDAGRSAEATSLHDRLVHRLRTDSAMTPKQIDAVRKQLTALDPKLKELNEWRRWGAQQAREGLCEEAAALAAQAGSMKPGKLATRVKALREKWQTIDKGVGPAAEELWTRFNSACETAYAPAKALFEAQAAERKDNAAKKRALCERLEEYVRTADWEQPDWEAAVKMLDTVRREWRDIGGVTPKQFARLSKRYRAAVASLDDKLAAEREREHKRRLATIEELRTSLDGQPLESQMNAAKRAQREWRPTVRLRRKDEQKLWEELRTICDQIFARRDERFASRREAEGEALGARRALCDELLALLPEGESHADAAVSEARASYARLRKQWQAAGSVAPKDRAALERRWRDASKALEARLAQHARRAAGKANDALLTRALLVADRAQATASGDAPALATAEAAWSALDEQRGDLVRALDDAWKAVPGHAAADDTAKRRELCIRVEMLADVDSPAQDQGQRMALKVALLGQAMSGEAQSAQAQLHALLRDWAAAGPATADDYPPLRERFAAAARALNEAR